MASVAELKVILYANFLSSEDILISAQYLPSDLMPEAYLSSFI